MVFSLVSFLSKLAENRLRFPSLDQKAGLSIKGLLLLPKKRPPFVLTNSILFYNT